MIVVMVVSPGIDIDVVDLPIRIGKGFWVVANVLGTSGRVAPARILFTPESISIISTEVLSSWSVSSNVSKV